MFNNNKRKTEKAAQIVFPSPNQQTQQASSEPIFPKPKGLSRSLIAILSVLFLGAVAAYFLYSNEDKESSLLSTTQAIKPNNTGNSQGQIEGIAQRDSLLSGINQSKTTKEDSNNPNTSSYINSAGTLSEQLKDSQNIEHETTISKNADLNNVNSYKQRSKEPEIVKTQYKVLSKAYFYGQPNQKSRRPDFINHWKNSYTPLNALDKKNGFIYVVFTDDHGKTSEGWLRKKDVKSVKSIMYASDNK